MNFVTERPRLQREEGRSVQSAFVGLWMREANLSVLFVTDPVYDVRYRSGLRRLWEIRFSTFVADQVFDVRGRSGLRRSWQIRFTTFVADPVFDVRGRSGFRRSWQIRFTTFVADPVFDVRGRSGFQRSWQIRLQMVQTELLKIPTKSVLVALLVKLIKRPDLPALFN